MSDLKQRLASLSPTARQLLAERVKRARQGRESSLQPNKVAHQRRRTVVDLFESWVERTPSAIALSDGQRQLTYAELDALANRLANRINESGVGREKPVAFCLDRSIESVTAMLAALKAGAAYVPIDPLHPPPRIEFILGDTSAAVLLVNDSAEYESISFTGEVIGLDLFAEDFLRYRDTRPDLAIDSQSLASVMYTSGSTGSPKGVCIEHRSITRLVSETNYIEIQPSDCVAHASNPAFDAATFEVWGALLNGARLEILAPSTVLSADTLQEQIPMRQLSILFLTTALFNEMANAIPDMFTGLRYLLFGGEAASLSVVRRVVEKGKPTHLINAYGPTENTTFTTSYEIGEEVLRSDQTGVPIGRAVRNTYVRVLDEHLQPVMPGEVGELYTGGEGLAREYLNRPDLTRDVFIADPLADEAGHRLYKTGDLVLLREDGNLEFHGRNDFQIKIRGVRIESAEIQTILEQCPGISSAVILVHGDDSTNKVLVACVKPAPGVSPDWGFLQKVLKMQLPAYMVPACWILVDEWPLTANAKIDRIALSGLVKLHVGADESSKVLAARDAWTATGTEPHLAALVADLLGLETVGSCDDFFDIGGHSLLAMRLIFRVEQQFGVKLPIQIIFDHPVMKDLAEKIDALGVSGVIGDSKPGRESELDAWYPLSPMQQRLWFLEQLEPGSVAYHMFQAVRLAGPLDVPLLEQALNLVIERHDALRTCFALEGQDVYQRVRPTECVALRVIDLVDAPAASLDDTLQQHFEELFEASFDLLEGPLFRVELIRIGANEHVLCWVMHHIISDSWSMNVFRKEMAEAYRALRHDDVPGLPLLSTQYGDYSQSCMEFEQQSEYTHQLAYWKTELAGLPDLDLPTDYPRPQRQIQTGADCRYAIDPVLTKQIRAFCKGQSVTPFMLFMAVYQLLLARISNQTDIAVGVPIAGRNRIETEPLIGFFVNSLVIRGDLTGHPTFETLLAHIRQTSLQAYSNDTVPFDRLVEELQPARNLNRNPLYDVMLNLVHDTLEYDFADLNAKVIARESVESKFAMTLYVVEQQARIDLRLVYQTALFSGQRMIRFLTQFVSLLQQVLRNPLRTIDCYTLISPADVDLLPDPRCVITEVPIPSVLSRFLKFAELTPDTVAVDTEGQSCSYRQLAGNARVLAGWLQQQGAGNGDVIAVSGESTVGVVVAILAVLMVGGVIMPFDPRLPAARKTLMLKQADATRLLLVDSGDSDGAGGEWADAPVVHRLNPEHGLPDSEFTTSADFHFVEPDPDAPAYVFFTSGSTGVPKAVLGCHKGLDHFVDWQIGTFSVTSADRVAQLTSLSFDVVLRDLFLPLASGGTLCLPTEKQTLSPLRWLDEAGITVLHIVPTLASSWLSEVPEGVSLEQLRCVFFAGESLQRSLVSKWREAFPRAGRLINLYGPTETTLVKSYFEVPAEIVTQVLPIGRALPQTQILILREGRHLCGIGECGEIAIRTPYRSLGYCNLEQETRMRFVSSPFTNDDRDILYLTGDRGVYQPDGTVQMLGRVDDQVKIRGVRVEPDEVTAVLSEFEVVDCCHVTAVSDQHDETVLACYVVVNGDHQCGAQDLKAFLEQRLPSALVPSAYVFLEDLPHLPNGKIDRKSLPAPEIDPSQEYVAPRTGLERQLADIWSELLKVTRVGVDDDFFLAGGHSVLAMQLVSRINENLGIELPLRRIFEMPTVGALAGVIENLKQLPQPECQAERSEKPRQCYPMSFTQQRLWFLEQLEPGGTSYNINDVYSLHGELDSRALEAALNEIARRHSVLRTAITLEDGLPIQVISPEINIRLQQQDISHLSGSEQASELDRQLSVEQQQSFDLSMPPLLRARLFRLSPQEHVFSLTLHHIITDGWSAELVNRELSHFYGYFAGHHTNVLPNPAAQFGECVLWQQRRLSGHFLETELAWWRYYLKGVPPLDLATDHRRPSTQSGRGASYRLCLPAELTREIKSFSQRQGVTVFMSLLAAFNGLLYRYTGQRDVIIGTPLAGRNRVSDESVMGYFANTVILRSQLSGKSTFTELACAARDTMISVFEHQEVPFEKLVEVLAPKRDLSRNPIFQIMFALQNIPTHPLQLTGIKTGTIPVRSETAKFDLSLTLVNDSEGLSCDFNYSTDLFEVETIERMAGHYGNLLRSALLAPNLAVSKLEMLSSSEVTQLKTWNETSRDYPPYQAVHQLIEERALRTPGAGAVTWGGSTLSYRQLNEQANRFAHYLIELGVGAEELVGICLERSPRMLVAMLAVMKAGGAYVPLDPAYPVGRLAYMLEDSAARILISSWSQSSRLPKQSAARLLDLDQLEVALKKYPLTNPDLPVPPQHLAYVIYTSGSTGRPKGVMIEHGSLAAFVRWVLDFFTDEERAVVLASTSLNFDMSVLELLGTLAGGGRVVLVDSVLQLPELADADEVTLIHTVPSALRELTSPGAIPGSVRVICSGGETLSAELADALYMNTAISRLVDAYGPTEDTVYSTHALREPGGVATIGRPRANASIYILDADLRPVPVGVPGELFIAGQGLARGYLNQPELTAERFVEVDFGRFGSERCYRTGDQAKYLPDGRIVLLGRLDNQVKIRGHRVETGEVEAVLTQFSGVRQALVVVTKDTSDNNELVAYVECEGAELDCESLGGYLRHWLPAYMVPGQIEVLERFPLLPNGKIDRLSLPEPRRRRSAVESEAPATATERELSIIWRELLGVERIGCQDDFFELGGHSLLATRLVSRLDKHFGVRPPLAGVFEKPTLAQFALYLDLLHVTGGTAEQSSPDSEVGEI